MNSTLDNRPEKETSKNKWGMKENFKKYLPILLSHHPICDKFDSHVVKIGKYKYCIGCLFGNTAGIISLILLFVLRNFGMLPPWNFFILGLYLMLAYVLSIVGLTKYRSIKILSKIIIGIGFSFILFSIWTLDFPFWGIFVGTAILMYVCMLPINIKRIYEMNKICNGCVHKDEKNDCPGFIPPQYFEK